MGKLGREAPLARAVSLCRLHRYGKEESGRLGANLDRKVLIKLQENRGAKEAALLRTMHSGALLTRERQHRHRGLGVPTCHCEEATASFEHICWSCPTTSRLWSVRTRPNAKVERCCGLPLRGRSWRWQEGLSAHAMACWTCWLQTDRAHTGEEEDGALQSQEEAETEVASISRHETTSRRQEEEEEPQSALADAMADLRHLPYSGH